MKRNALLLASIVLFVAAVVLAPIKLTAAWSLTATVAAVVAFLAIAGKLIGNSWWAVLITSINTLSLSRAQTVLWTVLICASFMTVAFARLGAGVDALAFAIPDTLLGLIGISLTSAVATSAVMSGKAAKQATGAQVAAAEARTNEKIEPCGTLFGYKDKSKASLMDMFEGDELGDAHAIDLGKVQMFFFTVVGAVVYLGTLYAELRRGIAPSTLPDLPQNLIVLMGMSHAGYIGNKLVNRTPDAPQPQAPAPIAGTEKPLPATAGDQARIPVAQT